MVRTIQEQAQAVITNVYYEAEQDFITGTELRNILRKAVGIPPDASYIPSYDKSKIEKLKFHMINDGFLIYHSEDETFHFNKETIRSWLSAESIQSKNENKENEQ